MTKQEKTQNKKMNEKTSANTNSCDNKDCPFHGSLKARGRTFEGVVVRKHDKRLAIEFERMIYIKKFERYARKKTRVHARLPKCLESTINIGDLIKIQECRPLSKIIHFVVIEKIKDKEELK